MVAYDFLERKWYNISKRKYNRRENEVITYKKNITSV